MTTAYLAARYSRREELCGYRADLAQRGVKVPARWLNGNHQVDDAGLSIEAAREERERFATEDLDDILSADLLIARAEVWDKASADAAHTLRNYEQWNPPPHHQRGRDHLTCPIPRPASSATSSPKAQATNRKDHR